jgi:hypothetical protein
MNAKEKLTRQGVEVTRRDRPDGPELVADFGPGADVAVDVVGSTVIVVEDNETFDIDVDGEAQAFIRNGVLTIDVREEGQK